MLAIEKLYDKRDGTPLRGFFVRNRIGKLIAIGAENSFVQISRPRYSHDASLVTKIGRLTGLTPRL